MQGTRDQGTGTSTKFERVLVKWDACELGMKWIKERGHRSLTKAWDDSYSNRHGHFWREWFVECLLDELEMWIEDTGAQSELERVWMNGRYGVGQSPAELTHYRSLVRVAYQRVKA